MIKNPLRLLIRKKIPFIRTNKNYCFHNVNEIAISTKNIDHTCNVKIKRKKMR